MIPGYADIQVSQKEVPPIFEKSLPKFRRVIVHTFIWLESVLCFWCTVKKNEIV